MTVTQLMLLVTGIKGRMAAQPRKGCSGSAGSGALLFLLSLTSSLPGQTWPEKVLLPDTVASTLTYFSARNSWRGSDWPA